MKYLLDSNVFIEAKNHYYGMEFCPAFWDWLIKAHELGIVSSIARVQKELLKGKDELCNWCKKHPNFFSLDLDDDIQNYTRNEIANAVYKNYSQQMFIDYLDVADPWLIATAKVKDYVLVTHEKFRPKCKSRILIPNICEQIGLRYTDTFTMLCETGAQFVLKRG